MTHEGEAMTALSETEQATLDRIEAAEPAPESFDAVAALRRVEVLANDLNLEAADQDPWDGNCVAAYEDIADRIRAALRSQA